MISRIRDLLLNHHGTIEPKYQYENQRFDPLFNEGGNTDLIGAKFDNRFILNFRIEKAFMDKNLSLFVFGNYITSKPFVEGVNQLETAYPKQVGGIF